MTSTVTVSSYCREVRTKEITKTIDWLLSIIFFALYKCALYTPYLKNRSLLDTCLIASQVTVEITRE